MHTSDRARPRSRPSAATTSAKSRLLPEDDPVLIALGISDQQGRVKPSRQAKYRQVEEFLRLLDASITDALDAGHAAHADRRGPAADRRPRLRQRLPDLRRARYLTHVRGLPVHRHRGRRQGAVPRPQQRGRRRARHRGRADFVVGTHRRRHAAAGARRRARAARLRHRDRRRAGPGGRVGGRRWCSPRPAATTTSPPSCAEHPTPAPYALLTRHGILRERFADTLTDALRAALLRLLGYRVDVVEFVESQHTPRNTLLRAVRTGGAVRAAASARSTTSCRRPGRVRPRLAELLERPADAWTRSVVAARRAVVPGRRRPSRRPAPTGDVVFALRGPGDLRVQRAGRRRSA